MAETDGLVKDGEKVVPALVELLKDPTSAKLGDSDADEPYSAREAAVKALLLAGPDGAKALVAEGLPLLRAGLKDAKPEVREHAAHALALVGPKSKPAVDDLIALGSDSTKEVRRAAYGALAAIGDVPATPVLQLLGNADADVRRDAAQALSWLTIPPSAFDTLLKAMTDKRGSADAPEATRFVRDRAAAALATIAPKEPKVLPALIDLVKKADPNELAEILKMDAPEDAGALLALRRVGKPAVASLVPLLKDDKPEVRWQATVVLGAIGPDAKEAAPDLKAALDAELEKRQSLDVLAGGFVALLRVGGDLQPTLDSLKKVLDDGDARVRQTRGVGGRPGRPAGRPLGQAPRRTARRQRQGRECPGRQGRDRPGSDGPRGRPGVGRAARRLRPGHAPQRPVGPEGAGGVGRPGRAPAGQDPGGH